MAKQPPDEPKPLTEVPPDDGGGPSEPGGDEVRLARICKQLAKAYGVAVIVIPQRDADNDDYLRIVPAGHPRAAAAILEAAITEGELVEPFEERDVVDDDD